MSWKQNECGILESGLEFEVCSFNGQQKVVLRIYIKFIGVVRIRRFVRNNIYSSLYDVFEVDRKEMIYFGDF